MEKPKKTLAVVMQRRPARSRWEDFVWEPWSVIESDEPAGAPRLLVEKDGVAQWLHPGFELVIHRFPNDQRQIDASALDQRALTASISASPRNGLTRYWFDRCVASRRKCASS